jgi:hypothetical protein
MKSAEFLNTASIIVSEDREMTHGHKIQNHVNIANLWSAYKNIEITAHDVAVMMALLKIARTKTGNINKDDYVDACGYMSIAGEIVADD